MRRLLRHWLGGVSTVPIEPPATPSQLFSPLAGAWQEHGNAFDSVAWLDSAESYLRSVATDYDAGRLVPEHYYVPIALLAAERGSTSTPVRVLDFGGGLGPTYFTVVAALPSGPSVIAYDIVDSAANCARGSILMAQRPGCTFATVVPRRRYDIVLASSVLQYIEDWRGTLQMLASRQADHICLTRLSTTRIGTFAALQDVRFASGPHAGVSAGQVAHWFFNLDELAALLSAAGYELMYDHFISSYADYVAHFAPAEAACTLRCIVFRRIAPADPVASA